jgi:hypothetical protein
LSAILDPTGIATTKILCAQFSNSDSSKIAYATSEGSLQAAFGGHLCVIDMLRKQLDRVYKEPYLVTGGVSFNTNDSMLASGNKNGDVTIRNLNSQEGNFVNKLMEA